MIWITCSHCASNAMTARRIEKGLFQMDNSNKDIWLTDEEVLSNSADAAIKGRFTSQELRDIADAMDYLSNVDGNSNKPILAEMIKDPDNPNRILIYNGTRWVDPYEK